MFKSYKFLMIAFFAGFGCLNAAESTGFLVQTADVLVSIPLTVITVCSRVYSGIGNVVSTVKQSYITEYQDVISPIDLKILRGCTLSEDNTIDLEVQGGCTLSEDGYGGYVLASNNPVYVKNPLKTGVEKIGTLFHDSKNNLKDLCDIEDKEKASVQTDCNAVKTDYNIQKIALIGAGAVVAALVAYKIYQYVQCLSVNEQELINSILTSASQESEIEAFEKIVSWTGVEVVKNAESVVLTNDQIKSVLQEVAQIKSADSKKLIIAMMLTYFDMNEKARKNVVAKLRSL